MGNQREAVRKTLLIGNGLNLAVTADNKVTWASLLDVLLKGIAPYCMASYPESRLSFSEKMSLPERVARASENIANSLMQVKKKWLKKAVPLCLNQISVLYASRIVLASS